MRNPAKHTVCIGECDRLSTSDYLKAVPFKILSTPNDSGFKPTGLCAVIANWCQKPD